MFKPELIRRLLRFGIVGAGTMGVNVGLNYLLAPSLGKHRAYFVAYVPALVLHFCLNKWWTFGCERTDAARQVGEYLMMAGVTFLIQTAVFETLVTLTPMPSWLASGVAIVAQLAVTFVVMQRRVFAPSNPK